MVLIYLIYFIYIFWFGTLITVVLIGFYTILGDMKSIAYNVALQTVQMLLTQPYLFILGYKQLWAGLW